jgi:hypothetical protein
MDKIEISVYPESVVPLILEQPALFQQLWQPEILKTERTLNYILVTPLQLALPDYLFTPLS